MQAGGVDAGRGRGRRWRGQGRQEETPSNSRLGAREGVAVDRVRRGGHRRPKKEPHPLAFEARGGVGGTRQRGVAGINKVSCKFHVTLFGCRVGGDVGQLYLFAAFSPFGLKCIYSFGHGLSHSFLVRGQSAPRPPSCAPLYE